MSILDWAAFTLPIMHTEIQPSHNAFQIRIQRVTRVLETIMPSVLVHSTSDLTPCTPQRPYRQAWQCPNVGWRINADWKRKEALIVFNGAACEQVRKIGNVAESALLRAVGQTGTRLDIATDIETNVLPDSVEQFGWAKRIISRSHIVSNTGSTLYIGSRKSEAFCRVYRYNPPHPRSHLMRVEFELKKDRAKAVANIGAGEGVDIAGRSVAARFEFAHPTIQDAFKGSIRQILTTPHERSMAITEQWLLTQCVPAFLRLVDAGVIDDPSAWVNRYMLGNQQNNSSAK
jgi:hypothetical protein